MGTKITVRIEIDVESPEPQSTGDQIPQHLAEWVINTALETFAECLNKDDDPRVRIEIRNPVKVS